MSTWKLYRRRSDGKGMSTWGTLDPEYWELIEEPCKCICHEKDFPLGHDGECCENMNGVIGEPQEERAITKEEVLSIIFKLCFKFPSLVDELHKVQNYVIETSHSTTSSKEWEEIEKEFWNNGISEWRDIVEFFKHYFLSLQQRAEKAEQRIKEIEADNEEYSIANRELSSREGLYTFIIKAKDLKIEELEKLPTLDQIFK